MCLSLSQWVNKLWTTVNDYISHNNIYYTYESHDHCTLSVYFIETNKDADSDNKKTTDSRQLITSSVESNAESHSQTN